MRTLEDIQQRAQVLAHISLLGMGHVAGYRLQGCRPEWQGYLAERGLEAAASPEEHRLVQALHEGRPGHWGNRASWACEPLAVLGWLLGHGPLPPFYEPATPTRWIDRIRDGRAPTEPPPDAEARVREWRRLFWIHRRMHAFVRGVQRMDMGAWMARCGAAPEALGVPLVDGELIFDELPLSEWSVWEMEYQDGQADITGGRLRALRWACGEQPAWDLVPVCPHLLDGDPSCGPSHAYATTADAGGPDLDDRGRLPAHAAALDGEAPERWPDQPLHAQDVEGRDLLEHALALDLPDALPGILARGADLEARDGGQQTALLRALRHQSGDVALALLELGADTTAVDARCQGALHWAACGGVLEPLDRLLALGLDPEARTAGGSTALGLALTNGHPEAAARLIAAGAHLSAVTGDGRPALHISAREGDAATVARLLDAGAAPDEADAQGHTALHFAASAGHAEVVARLLEAGADPSARSAADFTPLIAAAMGHGTALVPALIAAGADLDVRESGRGGAALHYAAEGAPEAVRALLEAGAEPRPKDAKGHTPLQWARRAKDEASAALLKGARRPQR